MMDGGGAQGLFHSHSCGIYSISPKCISRVSTPTVYSQELEMNESVTISSQASEFGAGKNNVATQESTASVCCFPGAYLGVPQNLSRIGRDFRCK